MIRRKTNQRSTRARRSGSTYIAVMGVALIVSILGMAAMVTARLELRRGLANEELEHVRCLAQNALEFGLANLENDPNWRTSFMNNVETFPLDFTGISGEQGEMTFKFVDEKDGNLADDESDPVRLYGIGRVGQGDYVMSVLLEPTGGGLDCLTSALHAHARLWINNSANTITATGAPISSNNLLKNWGTVDGDVQCDGTNPTGTITGTLTDPAPAKTMPGPNVWDYYLTNGTWIDVDDIPGTAPNLIEKVVLSPGNNPFGDAMTNPEGIYVIDCENQDIRIKLVRLVGTLVLLNPGSGSDLDNDQHWEPAVPNFPVLMVDGDITFNWHGEHNLRESMAGVNYNPAHTPYQNESDTDQTDEYPPLIKGLVYISDDLDITHECVLEGVLITEGYFSTYDNVTLTYDPVFLNNPPPGFRAAGSGGSNLLSNPGGESGTSDWYVEGTGNLVLWPCCFDGWYHSVVRS